jgi:8-oxo-dGTP pyrophosphatase MutT (NUDIX family)
VKWTVHGERAIYESDWVNLSLVDVEIPGGDRFEHHVVRFPREATSVVVTDPERGVLMLWRHRFITDSWGWEVPAGGIEAGETPAEAAEREAVEEAGWRPLGLHRVGTYAPSNGVSDQVFHVFTASGAEYVGEPTDPSESSRIDWVPLDEVRRMIREGEVYDGLSLTSLLWALAGNETGGAPA